MNAAELPKLDAEFEEITDGEEPTKEVGGVGGSPLQGAGGFHRRGEGRQGRGE